MFAGVIAGGTMGSKNLVYRSGRVQLRHLYGDLLHQFSISE
jgi:hypothetical protein